jgi:hypothetical protein
MEKNQRIQGLHPVCETGTKQGPGKQACVRAKSSAQAWGDAEALMVQAITAIWAQCVYFIRPSSTGSTQP